MDDQTKADIVEFITSIHEELEHVPLDFCRHCALSMTLLVYEAIHNKSVGADLARKELITTLLINMTAGNKNAETFVKKFMSDTMADPGHKASGALH